MKGTHNQTGQHLSGIDHLRQSIRDILTTPIGTRVMRRNYGSSLPELVDNPINQNTLIELYAATAKAILHWEPRFDLKRVRVLSAGVGRLSLELEGFDKISGDTLVLRDLKL